MNLGQTLVSSLQEYIGDKPKGSSKRIAGLICLLCVAGMITASLIPSLHYAVDKPVLDSLLLGAGAFFGVDATKQMVQNFHNAKFGADNTPAAPEQPKV